MKKQVGDKMKKQERMTMKERTLRHRSAHPRDKISFGDDPVPKNCPPGKSPRKCPPSKSPHEDFSRRRRSRGKVSYAEVLARAESWGRNYRNIKLRMGPYQPKRNKIDIICDASENIAADNRRHIFQSYYSDDPGQGLSQDSSGLTGVGI
jgi:hypothetical protein